MTTVGLLKGVLVNLCARIAQSVYKVFKWTLRVCLCRVLSHKLRTLEWTSGLEAAHWVSLIETDCRPQFKIYGSYEDRPSMRFCEFLGRSAVACPRAHGISRYLACLLRPSDISDANCMWPRRTERTYSSLRHSANIPEPRARAKRASWIFAYHFDSCTAQASPKLKTSTLLQWQASSQYVFITLLWLCRIQTR